MGPNGYSYNRFAFDGEKEEHIREIIDITLQLVNQKIDENWIATLDVPLAAEIAMTKLLTVVNLAMYPHDGNIKLNLPLEHFQPDPEPRRCPVDSWARGAG